MLYISVSHELYNFDKIWFANMHYTVRIDVPQSRFYKFKMVVGNNAAILKIISRI